MPTYDYECEKCGEIMEVFHSISATPKLKCPKCGARKMRKLLGSGAGFLFKGSGFYITDYRSEDYKRKAKADAGGKSGGGESGSGGETSGGKPSTAGESKPGAVTGKSGESGRGKRKGTGSGSSSSS